MRGCEAGRSTLAYESRSLCCDCDRALTGSIKEDLRKQFAKKASDLTDQLKRVEHQIGSLVGSLTVGLWCTGADRQEQRAALDKLALLPPKLRVFLDTDIAAVHRKCQEAKIEENDYTVLTFDDLEYELELAERAIRTKIAFVENQVRPFDGVIWLWLTD